MHKFWLRLHWRLFLRFQLLIPQHWFIQRYGVDHYLNLWWLVYWRKLTSLGLNELKNSVITLSAYQEVWAFIRYIYIYIVRRFNDSTIALMSYMPHLLATQSYETCSIQIKKAKMNIFNRMTVSVSIFSSERRHGLCNSFLLNANLIMIIWNINRVFITHYQSTRLTIIHHIVLYCIVPNYPRNIHRTYHHKGIMVPS